MQDLLTNPGLLASHDTTQKTQNFCITFVQRRPNVEDVRPTVYKYNTNVLCFLGTRQSDS